MEDIGILTSPDEYMNHQIVDTFTVVQESDRGWTEKVWASLARKDGSMQVDFGLGKYINRNVLDAFAGVARGREQWTVRGSRALDTDVERTGVGPIDYEVVKPLKSVRFKLDQNDQGIAFDLVFEGDLPPFFEKRNRVRAGFRVAMDVIRYHQGGRVSGWIEIAGERHEVGDDWYGFRDHSWGMRGDIIGAAPPDITPGLAINNRMKMFWGPWLMRRPDGSFYEIQHFLLSTDHYDYYSGFVNHADGTQEAIMSIDEDVRFDRDTRVFLGGTFTLNMANGQKRVVEVEPLGDTAFHLRTGEYGSWKGGRHGSWRGGLHLDGEYIPDTRQALHELGQFRDKPVIVREGDAVGYGIQESILRGDWPDYGVSPESDFPTDI